MIRFAALIDRLACKPRDPASDLAAYLRLAAEADRMAALAVLSGHRPKRIATAEDLQRWSCAAAGIPDWLFEASLAASGDRAETTALVLPVAAGTCPALADVLGQLRQLAGQPEPNRRSALTALWSAMPPMARQVLNRMVTGSFRQTLPPAEISRALADVAGMDPHDLALRLAVWDGRDIGFGVLIGNGARSDLAPLPFTEPRRLDTLTALPGPATAWTIEPAQSGIACQLVVRPGSHALWTHDGRLITDQFPEFALTASGLPPDTVVIGHLTAPAPRWTARRPSRTLLTQFPARMTGRDLMEIAGQDLRDLAFVDRRARLATLITATPRGYLDLAPILPDFQRIPPTGLTLTRSDAPHPSPQWHLPPVPQTITAVMLYAETGHPPGTSGPEITLAVLEAGEPLPVARARLALPEADQRAIQLWVRSNALERFGPLRRVPAELVFDLAFDGAKPSPRRQSGLALTNPRILRWRKDGAAPATLTDLCAALAASNETTPPESP